MKRGICILLFILTVGTLSAQTVFRIISYNVENLFDYRHDTLKNDFEYLPDSMRHWSYTRFRHKTEQLARVICNIGEWEGAALVGLCEVENDYCLRQLNWQLKRYGYRYLHYDSPDERGIDVALLYRPDRFCIVDSAALPVSLGDDRTRDILYAAGRISGGDTLHVFVCHLPSMIGGQAASQWKRDRAKAVLQNKIDSLYVVSGRPKIVVMGDMNSQPVNDLRGMTNRMTDLARKGKGTHKYQGIWSCLDQFYTSPTLDSISQVCIYDEDWLQEPDTKYLGMRPRRTYIGFKYQKGSFSDHLPIVMDITQF